MGNRPLERAPKLKDPHLVATARMSATSAMNTTSATSPTRATSKNAPLHGKSGWQGRNACIVAFPCAMVRKFFFSHGNFSRAEVLMAMICAINPSMKNTLPYEQYPPPMKNIPDLWIYLFWSMCFGSENPSCKEGLLLRLKYRLVGFVLTWPSLLVVGGSISPLLIYMHFLYVARSSDS